MEPHLGVIRSGPVRFENPGIRMVVRHFYEVACFFGDLLGEPLPDLGTAP